MYTAVPGHALRLLSSTFCVVCEGLQGSGFHTEVGDH